MRAIYYQFDKLKDQQTIVVTGDAAKHLHVVRVKENEDILVLNGKGARALSKVGDISKNQISLRVQRIDETSPFHQIGLAIATPKKEAFEDILKMAVELGVLNIYPLSSDFSQYDYQESERINRILESAMIQSNNSFMPVIHQQQKLRDFVNSLNVQLAFFNSKPVECGKAEKINRECIVLIGPEGGFSPSEDAHISAKSNSFSIHLPTPIQRAPTAVASSVGYLLSIIQLGSK
ncbi:MAG: RsmE family RNA methyltransferase [Bacteriovorax sp.]